MRRIQSSLAPDEHQLKRCDSFKRKPERVRIKRSGRKVKEWDRVRAALKVRFAAAGITSCEVKRLGCFRDNWLGFAHADKRRFLSQSELHIAILACVFCHSALEILSRPNMKKAVLAIIAEREVQP